MREEARFRWSCPLSERFLSPGPEWFHRRANKGGPYPVSQAGVDKNVYLRPAVVGLTIDLELKSEIASDVFWAATTGCELRDSRLSTVES